MSKYFTFLTLSIVLFSLVISASASGVTIENPLYSNNIVDLLDKIAKAVAGIVGSISVIMIVVAGIMFLTSAGNPGKMESAKKALIYAIIGIVVAVIAGTIVVIVKEVLGVSSSSSGGPH